MKKMGILIFSLTLAVGLSSTISCNIGDLKSMNGVQGSGRAKSETRNVSDFKMVDASSAMYLEIAAGKEFSVQVEADDNLLQYIKTDVSGDTLKIYSKGNISPKTKINVKISMPELTGLEVSGASNASVSNAMGNSIELKASGASEVKIEGEVKNVKLEASGASAIEAETLKCQNADAHASGASTITTAPANDLTAEASGASNIFYTGEPKNIEQNSSGASSVKEK